MRVPFGDLAREFEGQQARLEQAALRVLRSGRYVLADEVTAFEREWAAFCGVEHAVGVASGTDALHLALRGVGVGPGDEVITVPNAAGYTAFALRQIGARPVYADVDARTWTIDPVSVDRRVTGRTRAIVPVHLYGAPADMRALAEVARRHNIPIVEDCAQAHGAEAHGRPVGAWGVAACWSFYPTKNLGALGDGGAVTTGDAALSEKIRRLRQYGWTDKYCAVEPGGFNSRLDELQASLLRVKLGMLPARNERRRAIARLYHALLAGTPGLELPAGQPGHVYHLFVIRVLDGRRDALRDALARMGIGAAVHYPMLDYLQPALAGLGDGPGAAPVAERLANEVLSLPCYPELTDDEVRAVAEGVKEIMSYEL
ncbi:MAG TPA: DegT/DnrJ/EryC1/StrS family aminotransferase [Herpetosiphonaceae bacterium]|nr:DegT/DnrJ/EryC1/StrS family aminotransferase [Herpetosiphonaceae bacterium]